MRLLLPALFALFWSLQSSADQHPLEISAKNLSDIVKVMASDDFEGRAPGTPGEDKTVAYLIDANAENWARTRGRERQLDTGRSYDALGGGVTGNNDFLNPRNSFNA